MTTIAHHSVTGTSMFAVFDGACEGFEGCLDAPENIAAGSTIQGRDFAGRPFAMHGFIARPGRWSSDVERGFAALFD